MIELIGDFFSDQRTELFKVDNKAGFRIGQTLYSHNQVKIVSVPVLIGTGAEYLNVLLF
jgi:hypothetical protein